MAVWICYVPGAGCCLPSHLQNYRLGYLLMCTCAALPGRCSSKIVPGEQQAAHCMYMDLYVYIHGDKDLGGQQGAGLVWRRRGRLQLSSTYMSKPFLFLLLLSIFCIEICSLFFLQSSLLFVPYVLPHSFCVDSSFLLDTIFETNLFFCRPNTNFVTPFCAYSHFSPLSPSLFYHHSRANQNAFSD